MTIKFMYILLQLSFLIQDSTYTLLVNTWELPVKALI